MSSKLFGCPTELVLTLGDGRKIALTDALYYTSGGVMQVNRPRVEDALNEAMIGSKPTWREVKVENVG